MVANLQFPLIKTGFKANTRENDFCTNCTAYAAREGL